MHIIGHRGAAGVAPENTIKSFQKAVELGADGIEFDVRMAASGELVVIHDKTLERRTNGKGVVAETSFEAIRKLDAGEGEKIPTLTEVLAAFAKDLILFIEIKDPSAALKVAEEVARVDHARQMVIISFHVEVLRTIRQHYPRMNIGLNWEKNPWQDAKPILAELRPEYCNLAKEVVDAEAVKCARDQGIKIGVWTVNMPEDIARVKSLKVDAIFSDFPDRV